MQLVCILCQTVLPSTDQRFGKHMQEEHAMVAGNNLVRFLLACHFLNEPERALLSVRMGKRIEDHVKSEMEVSELEVLVLEQTKAPDAVTSFSNQLLRAMAETKVEKPEEVATVSDQKKSESGVFLVDKNATDRHRSFEQDFRKVNSNQSEQQMIEKSVNKNVFIKCRLCHSKVRKDLFDDHKTEHHPDFSELTANMRNEAEIVTLAEKSLNNVPQQTNNVREEAAFKHIFCKPCQKQFFDGVLFEKHKYKEHRGKEKSVTPPVDMLTTPLAAQPKTCQLCPEILLTKSDLRLHNISKHNQQVETCKLCYIRIYSKRTKRRHEVEYHKADAHLFNADIKHIKMESKCETCGMQFASEDIVKFHVKFMHSNKHANSLNPVKSTNCGPMKNDPEETATFSFDSQMGKFICSSCGTRIKDKWKMKRHMRNNHNVQTT